MQQGNNQNDKFSSASWKYAGVGFELAGSVGLFTLIGYFIDQRLNTAPKGLVIGAVVGIIVGLYLLIKEALTMNADDKGDAGRGPERTPYEQEKDEQRDDEREQKR